MLVLLLSLLQASADPQQLLATHARLTQAEVPCHATADDREIVVCTARDADRFRVPYITPTEGDPNIVDVPGERSRLIAQTNNCQEMRYNMTGCGMTGVSMTAGNGRGVGVEKPRPPAP
ncbi:hypothetical protein [Sphingomonas sp. 37zxx]|uniref:hypothetical protein n=1 Tax=Sphingomonas sp. 37zxx TaxID=1550073 RepID=UPI00068B48B0|nr:hypothetical protein [Sphingomonas sp. 37zxx]